MQVTIDKSEMKTGMIFKKTWFKVRLHILFNEEENQIIKKGELETQTLWQPPRMAWDAHTKSDPFPCRIRAFVGKKGGGYSLVCETPGEQAQAEEKLKEIAHDIKAMLEANTGETEASESFDL